MPAQRGIMQYWQTIAGMVSFVFLAGVSWGKFNAAAQKMEDLQGRQDRQFQLYNDVKKDIQELQKREAYNEGVHSVIK